MLKPLHLLAAVCCAMHCFAQKTDTITVLYKPDQYTISQEYKQQLDKFLLYGWDRISINGFTDETEGEEYNLELSKKRSGEIYRYFLAKNIPAAAVNSNYFGEAMPKADNLSDTGRALNRRTEIIGYRFARISVKPKEDPMKPVTKTLDNGFIITYQPGTLPDYMAANFEAGSGMNFQVISNTVQMRQNNLYNNTTNGEILSSVLIICGSQLNPCKLDSPILMKVPIPVSTNCPIEKVKFFNAVAEKGKRIWQEQSKQLYPEVIDGVKYIRLWMDDLCGCINFDFKIDPDCFDTDSTQLLYVKGAIRNLSAELKGLNSVYMPRHITDTTHSLLFLKDKKDQVSLSFRLLSDKRNIRSFRDQPLSSLPYDMVSKQYLLSAGTHKFYFPRQKVYEVVLKVNGDKYRAYPDKNKFEVKYLNRPSETVLVDFSIIGPKGRITTFKNQPIESLPFDAEKGVRVIDKDFLKALKEKGKMAVK